MPTKLKARPPRPDKPVAPPTIIEKSLGAKLRDAIKGKKIFDGTVTEEQRPGTVNDKTIADAAAKMRKRSVGTRS